ncbi:MAG: flavodoxin family protein [Gammaproteobacteria bacterium]|nr:flavodoxin family protein [Gammaproteobacteria bacterium]
MARKLLILFAHPSPQRSEINIPLFKSSLGVEGVTAVDLYLEYPNYQIDIKREQRRLLDHDCIIFMFPLYWYSTPAILKEWQDLVLEYGFAYGHEGHALHGKDFLCALSAGGPESFYRENSDRFFSIRELLRPLEQSANLCGMNFLPPFALFGARTALDEGRIDQHVADWHKVLVALRDETLQLEGHSDLLVLNDVLPELKQ